MSLLKMVKGVLSGGETGHQNLNYRKDLENRLSQIRVEEYKMMAQERL